MRNPIPTTCPVRGCFKTPSWPRPAERVLKHPLTVLGLLVAVLSVTPPVARTQEKPPAPARLRALIVTGEDVPAHPWRETTPVTRQILETTGRFEVRICEDIGILESGAIHAYDLLVLNFRNNPVKVDLPDRGRENLLEYVSSGKGLVTIHFAAAALHNWPEYRHLNGRVWVRKKSGHGPRGPFRAKIASREHAITGGLEDFEIDDELYAKLEGERPIHVLVNAYSDWSERVEPLVWTLDHGKGRVFSTLLGHDARARRNPSFAILLQRGAEWAATGEVKSP